MNQGACRVVVLFCSLLSTACSTRFDNAQLAAAMADPFVGHYELACKPQLSKSPPTAPHSLDIIANGSGLLDGKPIVDLNHRGIVTAESHNADIRYGLIADSGKSIDVSINADGVPEGAELGLDQKSFMDCSVLKSTHSKATKPSEIFPILARREAVGCGSDERGISTVYNRKDKLVIGREGSLSVDGVTISLPESPKADVDAIFGYKISNAATFQGSDKNDGFLNSAPIKLQLYKGMRTDGWGPVETSVAFNADGSTRAAGHGYGEMGASCMP